MISQDNQLNQPPIKVSIIDDDKSYRDSLKKILEKDKQIWLYNEYESGSDFIRDINSPFKPDVCLVDVVLKDMSGFECAKKIKEKKSDVNIIIMTAYPDEKSFSEARKIGADFIEKGPRIETLINKIIKTKKTADNDERIISLHSQDKLNFNDLELACQLGAIKQRISLLSEAQIRILKLKKEGYSNSEMADMLNINEGTIRTHLSRALKKLQLPDILDYLID